MALAKGELARATRCVDQLLEKFNELNLLHLKPSILYLQARISKAAGNHSAAIQLKERVNREALLIADHAGTEEFREIFLSRPDVQKVLVS